MAGPYPFGGPMEGQVRDFLLGDAADGLKKTAES